MKLSKAPFIASHSSTDALHPVARNMDDEQLMALKENGGVIQIVALDGFLKQDTPEKTAETLNVTTELVRRGYSEEDIRKLWGAHALRVWRDAERVSAEMKK